MNAGIVATRYAKAIYEFALEKGEEKLVYEGFTILINNFSKFPELGIVLNDPTVSAIQKSEVLLTACEKGENKTIQDVIKLILKNGRENYLINIALDYEEYYRKAKGIVIAKLITVEPANDKTKTELMTVLSRVTQNKIEFHTETDPDLIGGFVLEIEDKRLDASVKDQLNRMRIELKQIV